MPSTRQHGLASGEGFGLTLPLKGPYRQVPSWGRSRCTVPSSVVPLPFATVSRAIARVFQIASLTRSRESCLACRCVVRLGLGLALSGAMGRKWHFNDACNDLERRPKSFGANRLGGDRRTITPALVYAVVICSKAWRPRRVRGTGNGDYRWTPPGKVSSCAAPSPLMERRNRAIG